MNRLVHIAAAGTLLAFGAAAQNPEDMAKLAKAKAEADVVKMKMVGAVRGMTVKGAPYSGEEVNETTQMLADGTRIHRENRTTVYRDSEGRTRRESPDSITITDPVANVTYFLDPKTMTGQKLTMASGNFSFIRRDFSDGVPVKGDGPATFSFSTSGEGPTTVTVNGTPLEEKELAEAMAKAKASGAAQTFTYERREITTAVGSGSGTGIGVATASRAGAMGGMVMAGPGKMALRRSAGEPLGKQMIEGVNAEGTRNVSTIETGAIGNDRPIPIIGESWYSDELQMMIMSKHSDPRTGDESFRLTNIRRDEPGAYLFQAPAGYQITERK
jgi:hypothetical protein